MVTGAGVGVAAGLVGVGCGTGVGVAAGLGAAVGVGVGAGAQLNSVRLTTSKMFIRKMRFIALSSFLEITPPGTHGIMGGQQGWYCHLGSYG
jgi:hypothetical protein